MHKNHPNFKVSFWIILIFFLIWGGLNFGSYIFLKNYLYKNDHLIKEKIVNLIGLKNDEEYELSLNPQIHWGFIFLNVYIENFEFYNKKKQDFRIDAKNLNLSFLISNILNKKFVPYAIQSNKINVFLNENLFQNLFKQNNEINEEKNSFLKENLKKILLIKNFNLEKFNIQIISEKENSNSSFHFFKNFEIQKSGKKKFEIKADYLNNKNIEMLKINFFTKFNENLSSAKIYKLKTFFILNNFNKFPRIKKLQVKNHGNGEIFLNDRLKIEKLKLNLEKFDVNLFSDEKRNFEIAKINLTNNDDNQINLEYIPKNKTLKIHEVELILNNKKIFKLDSLFNFGEKDNTKKISQKISFISEISHNEFEVFWPKNFFSDTKKWYESSVSKGQIKSAKICFDLFFDQNWKIIEKKSNLNGKFNFDNLNLKIESDFLGEIKDLSGEINFNLKELTSKIKTGYIEVFDLDRKKEKIFLNSGSLSINFLRPKIMINGILKSNLKTMLNFYDNEFKIKVFEENIFENINGNGIANFDISINLGSKIKKISEQILVKVNISTSNLSLFLKNQGNFLNFTNGNFNLGIDNAKNFNFYEVNLDGSGLLNQKNFKIKTNRSLQNENKIISNLNFEVNYNDIKNILDPIIGSVAKINGDLLTNLEIINHSNSKNDEFNFNIDLKNSNLIIDYAKINKKQGENANLNFNMINEKNDFFVKNFKFTQEKNQILISNINYIDSKKELDVISLKFNKNIIDLVKFKSGNQENYTKIIAKQIFYHDFNWFGFEGDEKNKGNLIEGQLENLIFLDDLRIKNLNLEIKCGSSKCHSMKLFNDPEGQKKNHLNASLINDEINLFSDNAGLLLRGMNFIKYIFEGQISLKGTINQYKNGQFIIQNDLIIKNFYLRNAPAVAHLLSLASITGAFSDLRGKGIHFLKMTSNFVYYNDKIEFGKSIANGFSIGFSFDGDLDLKNNFFNIDGSIMPFNFINLALKKVPLIGEFLTGKPGEGFFSIDFDSYGSFEKPIYKVDAFRAFVPYFIKKIIYKKKQKSRKIN